MSALGCAAWAAARQRDVSQRVAGLGAQLLSRAAGSVLGPAPALAWRGLDGCSADRLAFLADLWWADHVEPTLHAPGLQLWRGCGELGHTRVLVSDHPRAFVAHLAEHLGADELVANRLEVVDGRCTGRLAEPVLSGRRDGGWIRAVAQRRGADPLAVHAYGAHAQDATLLSGAGRPCAVTPDPALRRLAHDVGWPVVEA